MRLKGLAIALMAALLALPGISVDAKTLKVALVLPGPITDGTFNSAAHKGMETAKRNFDIEVSMQENTGIAAMEEALTNYARSGYDVIIGHGFQFAEPASKIHKKFPKSQFIVTMAKVSGAPNLASLDVRLGDAGYVAGMLAGLITKTGVVGHVGGIPVPVIQEYADGFKVGAEAARPGVKVLNAFVGSFTDAAKGKEITLSLIERKADVVTATGNESVLGTINAAKDAKVMAINTFFDAAKFAPDTIVTTALVNLDVAINHVLAKVIDGSIKQQNYLLGFKEGVLGVAPYYKFDAKVTEATKERIDQLVADIKAGKVKDLPKVR